MATSNNDSEFAPLNIEAPKCTDSDCENNLHCFLRDKRTVPKYPEGRCQECGAELIDWPRVHRREVNDANHTIRMLQFELIRHHNWHKPIDQKAINHARRKGKVGIREAAEVMIRKKIGSANPAFDGRQTPKQGNIIYYAQHAVACCCRKCVQEWHGISMGRALSDAEVAYLTELVCLYIDQRLPELTEHGEKVPPIRKSEKSKEKEVRHAVRRPPNN